MPDKDAEIRPDGRSLGLPAYLVWLGNQLMATAVGAYATLDIGVLEARILFALGQKPNQLAAGLAHRLGVDRAAISRALQQLKAAGMIVADEDRRLSLSAPGWRKRTEVMGVSDERLARFTTGFTEPELEQLLGLLQRLHRNVPELFLFNDQLAAAGRRGKRPSRSPLERSDDAGEM